MKNTELVACESRLHARFCLHLEFEPQAIAYASRPFALHFADAAVTARPDFAAALAEGRRVYYQVGIAHEIIDPRQQDRMFLIRACLGRAGLTFEQLSPNQYQAVARTETLSSLYHHAHGASATQASRILQVLRDELNVRVYIDPPSLDTTLISLKASLSSDTMYGGGFIADVLITRTRFRQ
jgi:hypothetical protein